MIPTPITLLALHGEYHSLACPEDGCKWHVHGTTHEEAFAKYAAHWEETH